MKAVTYHLQVNVSSKKSLTFWKELLTFLEYEIISEWDEGFGSHSSGADIWVTVRDEARAKDSYHRKSVGLNHLAFGVSSRKDVDIFKEEFLKVRNITPLYSSPKEYPEYVPGYYAVYFEDLDRIKLEVVYKPGF